MRQFTTEEYQILLEGMEQLLTDYQEAETRSYEYLELNNFHEGMCLQISCYKLKYNWLFIPLFFLIVKFDKKNIYGFLFDSPSDLLEENGNYTKGIIDRINWLEQKISEIKNILNESNAQNRS